ncbi:MAG: BON domain-containing protein [Verrucomicrobiaceae bacterium]|nr:MAG: BON domain-containing protein [Verrucomicrobiaceae bacterium]
MHPDRSGDGAGGNSPDQSKSQQLQAFAAAVTLAACRLRGRWDQQTYQTMKLHPLALFAAMMPLVVPMTAVAEPDSKPETIDKHLTGTKPIGSAWRASEIIGTNVKNANDETIGEVKDLAVDFKTGEILAVIVSSGGFLGVADTLSSIPSSALRYDVKAEAFKTKLTKDQLQKAPQHKADDKAGYTDAALAKLREYRDSIGGDVNAPDNTANNDEDAEEKSVTPVDQGSSDSDVKTTKDIRSAVVDSDLSFNAKNIKIITNGGHVTLRGVVESKDEHAAVLKLVHGQVDKADVSDLLEVK